MKLFIADVTDFWDRVSFPLVAENRDQAFDRADLMAYNLLNGNIHDCHIQEVTEVEGYKVILEKTLQSGGESKE